MSKIPGLIEGTDYCAIRARYQAIVHYVQHHYFKVLERANHHVLYTIPPLNHDTQRLKVFKFQVVPFAHGHPNLILEGIYGRHSAIFARNSIVVAGMFGDHELAEGWFPSGVNWVGGFRENIPHGSVCFSRRVLLDAIILRELELVNRLTRIIPTFDTEDGELSFVLASRNSQPSRQESKNTNRWEWRTRKDHSNNDCLKYEWQNEERWRYDYKGGADGIVYRDYDIKCKRFSQTATGDVLMIVS